MEIFAGVLIEDKQGRILCGVCNEPANPYFGLLVVPWGQTGSDEDPYHAAIRVANQQLAGQATAFTIGRISACAQVKNGMLYLFRAGLIGQINLSLHGPQLSRLEWLTLNQIRNRGMVARGLLAILDLLY